MKGADYVDNDAPLAGGDPMDPIDGETGSFAVDADGPEGRRRRGDPNDADIDLAQQQLQREEEEQKAREKDPFGDERRKRRGQRKKKRKKDDDKAEHDAELYEDGMARSGQGQSRKHLFEEDELVEPGDTSLTDPDEIRKVLGTPTAYAKHVMILAEAFRRATGATRREAIEYLATMFVATAEPTFGYLSLKEFGPSTGIVDIYPLEVLERLLDRYPGVLPKVGFGKLFANGWTASDPLRTDTETPLLLRYPTEMRIRGFALKGGGRPGYMFSPADEPGTYELRIQSPGRYEILVSATNRSGYTVIDRIEVAVRPGSTADLPRERPEPYPPRDSVKVEAWPVPEAPTLHAGDLDGYQRAEKQAGLLSPEQIAHMQARDAMGVEEDDSGFEGIFVDEDPTSGLRDEPTRALDLEAAREERTRAMSPVERSHRPEPSGRPEASDRQAARGDKDLDVVRGRPATAIAREEPTRSVDVEAAFGKHDPREEPTHALDLDSITGSAHRARHDSDRQAHPGSDEHRARPRGSDKHRTRQHDADDARTRGSDKPRLREHDADKHRTRQHDGDDARARGSDKPRLREHDADAPSAHGSDKPRLREHGSDKPRLREHGSDKPRLREHGSDKPRLREHDADAPRAHGSDKPRLREPGSDVPRGEEHRARHEDSDKHRVDDHHRASPRPVRRRPKIPGDPTPPPSRRRGRRAPIRADTTPAEEALVQRPLIEDDTPTPGFAPGFAAHGVPSRAGSTAADPEEVLVANVPVMHPTSPEGPLTAEDADALEEVVAAFAEAGGTPEPTDIGAAPNRRPRRVEVHETDELAPDLEPMVAPPPGWAAAADATDHLDGPTQALDADRLTDSAPRVEVSPSARAPTAPFEDEVPRPPPLPKAGATPRAPMPGSEDTADLPAATSSEETDGEIDRRAPTGQFVRLAPEPPMSTPIRHAETTKRTQDEHDVDYTAGFVDVRPTDDTAGFVDVRPMDRTQPIPARFIEDDELEDDDDDDATLAEMLRNHLE